MDDFRISKFHKLIFEAMKSILTLIFLLSFAHSSVFSQISPAPVQKEINWMQGSWTGKGYQIDGDSWDIKLTHSEKRFTIEYPSLGCVGYWTINQTDKSRIVFTETIQKGNCDQNVKVIVTFIEKGFISVSYFIPKLFPDDVVAFSVLKKNN
jgi:hypothetical protein